MTNPGQALSKLADFLSVDDSKFDRTLIKQRVNASHLVRFPSIRLIARRFRNFLRQNDLDWLWNIAKASGMERIFEKPGTIPCIDPDVRADLILKYESDIAALEELTNIDLSVWRKPLLFNSNW